jgi:hypothetical protein
MLEEMELMFTEFEKWMSDWNTALFLECDDGELLVIEPYLENY